MSKLREIRPGVNESNDKLSKNYDPQVMLGNAMVDLADPNCSFTKAILILLDDDGEDYSIMMHSAGFERQSELVALLNISTDIVKSQMGFGSMDIEEG